MTKYIPLITIALFISIGLYRKIADSPKAEYILSSPTPTQFPVTPLPTTSPEITKSWKTYTQKMAGWSLKYPPNWHIYDKGFKYIDNDGKEKYDDTYHSVLISPNPFPPFIKEGTEFIFEGINIRFDPTKTPFQTVSHVFRQKSV